MIYIKELLNVGANSIILMGLLILFASKELISIADYFCDRFGIETKRSLKRKSDSETLEIHEININEIKNELKRVADKINVMSQLIVEQQQKTDSSEKARIKDRIAQSYRYYHGKCAWTPMEKEAFNDLIRDYESHGGINSFVHEICEPESFTWKVVE